MKKIIILILIILTCTILVGCKQSYSNKPIEYYCEEGTLEQNKCHIISTTEYKYTCNEDEILEENKCKYSTMKIPASTGDACGKGYYLYGNRCISEESLSRTIKDTICPEPENDDVTYEKGYGICLKYICTKKNADGSCALKKQEIVDGEMKYSCPSGYQYIYYACRKAYYANVKKACPSGELEDNYCVFYEYKDAKIECPEEYTYNSEKNICEKLYYTDALTK